MLQDMYSLTLSSSHFLYHCYGQPSTMIAYVQLFAAAFLKFLVTHNNCLLWGGIHVHLYLQMITINCWQQNTDVKNTVESCFGGENGLNLCTGLPYAVKISVTPRLAIPIQE